MLIELKISQFAIIDELHLHFKKGFNVLSGETGSGKSILLKGLGLLMGEKAMSDTIRVGHSQASVEGSFDISKRPDIESRLLALEIPIEDQMLIVRRVLSQGDKSKVFLNGTLSTLQNLRDIVAPMIEVTGHHVPLIEMTGQHDNRHLLNKSYHLDIVDQQASIWPLRQNYHELYSQYLKLKSELLTLQSTLPELLSKLDFLKFSLNEIERLQLEDLDFQALEDQIKRIKHSSRIYQFVEQSEALLISDEDSAFNRLQTVLKKSHEISQVDPTTVGYFTDLKEAASRIEDTIYELRQHFQNDESQTQDLETLENKLSSLRKLQKRYGTSKQDIFEAAKKLSQEIQFAENCEAKLNDLQKEISRSEMNLKSRGTELHKKRLQEAQQLSKKVNEELSDLNMKGVQFSIQVRLTQEIGPFGLDEIEFMSQNSVKDPARPLQKVSSGGELSRILLSLKKIVGTSEEPRTYLFDEVDSGVSGPTAEKVGRKLKEIAKGQQVICVTHLPQVASFGDSHFMIFKESNPSGVSTFVKELGPKERIQEIARLISGEKITKTSLAHAQELLQQR